MPFALTSEQQTAVENRGGALLVSAAAGSGKTRVLVERLMDYIDRGHNIDEFLVITFTNAAAAELRQRAARALSERLARSPQDGHLRRQTTLVYKAKICTIDALCLDLLRECGHLAGLDPDFRVCDETEGAAKRTAALEQVLEERYAQMDAHPGFRALADTLAGDRDDQTLAQVVEDIYLRVQAHPDPQGWLKERGEDFALPDGTLPEDTPWGRLLLSDAAQTARYWAGALERLAAEVRWDAALDANYGPGLELAASDLLLFSSACGEGWEQARQAHVRFPRAGTRKGSGPELRERVKEVWSRCKKQAAALEDRFSTPAGAVMEDLRTVGGAMSALVETVSAFGAAYRAEKGPKLLDFSDAEHLAVSLLLDGAGNPTPLALEWRDRFTEIMVDEYQDTNAAQNALFDALSRDGKNLFLVGDVKQSIYRFRLADPTIFLRKYNTYPAAALAEEGEPRKHTLSRNFRSRPEVLSAVNFLFRGLMSKELGELDYGEDQALYPGVPDISFDPACAAELRAVDLSGLEGEDGEDGGGEGASKDLAEARAVAARLRELYDGGFPVDGPDGPRPARWEDMAVLLRSVYPVLDQYAAAFSELDIPWTADRGEDFFQTTEVHTALSCLQIVDNPRQDVALLAVLRSPVWGFSPDRLALLRAGADGGDFYDALLAGEARGEADCAAFLSELRTLRAQAGERSSHRFLWYLYERTGMLGIFAAMEDGERRRENLLALYDCAQQFEGGGHKGLFGFLAHVARAAENGVKLPPPTREGGGVRLMSIHGSKGLEFPIAVVAGLGRRFNDRDLQRPILFHTRLGLGPQRVDREKMLRSTTLAREAAALALRQESRSEELRLLYVAMTRAQRKLILSTTFNGRLDRAAKLAVQAGYPVPPPVLASCPSMGAWVLLCALCRPDAQALHELAGQVPGAAVQDAGLPWDIQVLPGADYRRTPPRPAPAQARAQAAQPPESAAALAERFAWVYPHAAQADLPSKLTATQLKGRERDEEAAQDAPRPPAPRRPLTRPQFAAQERGLTPAQKGSALHLAMQLVRPDRAVAPDGAAQEIVRLVRGGWLTPQQGAAVRADWIAAFWRSPLGQTAQNAPQMEREFKFSLLVPANRYFPQAEEGEEILLQGVVDCWFRDAAGDITVIDFKTDAATWDTAPARAEEYRPQLDAYAQALAQVLGAPVRRRVLWFFRLGGPVELD